MPLVTDPDVDTILRKTPALPVRPIAHESVAFARRGTVGSVDLRRPYSQGARSDRIRRREECSTCRAAPAPGFSAATRRDADLSALLHSLKPIAGVQPYSFNTLLCDGKSCRTELDNTTLYRDVGHFSPLGSRVIGSQSSLNASVSTLLATTTGKP